MIYILYRPNSEHERTVTGFQRELDARHVEYELVSVDTRTGADKAASYGIMNYPAVLAVKSSDGQSLQVWSGQLPLLSEVEYYARMSV